MPRSIEPREAVLPVLQPGCRARAAPRLPGVGRQVPGHLRQGYEAIRATILARQKELGLLPDDTELSGINPHGEPGVTGPDGQPWPLLDTVRPWDSLSDDEKRLFIRMAEVFAGYVEYTDDQVGRVIDFLESSRRARQHDHRRGLRQRRQRRGRPQRHLQRVALLQRRAHPDRAHPGAHRRARRARVLQPLQHRMGVGVRHPLPLLEALGRLRGRHRRHVPGGVARKIAAAALCARSTCTPSTSCRPSTTCSASPRPADSTATTRARSRVRASPPR